VAQYWIVTPHNKKNEPRCEFGEKAIEIRWLVASIPISYTSPTTSLCLDSTAWAAAYTRMSHFSTWHQNAISDSRSFIIFISYIITSFRIWMSFTKPVWTTYCLSLRIRSRIICKFWSYYLLAPHSNLKYPSNFMLNNLSPFVQLIKTSRITIFTLYCFAFKQPPKISNNFECQMECYF
jgi:hypothetical protein